MEEIWQKIINFNDKYFPMWRGTPLVYYSNALAGEVGELCNLVKHALGGGTNKSKLFKVEPEDFALEVSDILIYLVIFLECAGITKEKFKEIFNRKMRINEIRMNETKEGLI